MSQLNTSSAGAMTATLPLASQKVRPTIARSGDVLEKYRAAKPPYELISSRGDQGKPTRHPPKRYLTRPSIIPAAPSYSFFTYDDDTAAPDYMIYPQPAPLPTLGGENKLAYDAAAQAAAESRRLKAVYKAAPAWDPAAWHIAVANL